MTAASKRRGGSFHELRDRHLFLFEGERVIHFHQRGAQPPVGHENGRPGLGPQRWRWKTAGIFHYMAHDAEEAGGEGGTSVGSASFS